jgi:hypothetical protein
VVCPFQFLFRCCRNSRRSNRLLLNRPLLPPARHVLEWSCLRSRKISNNNSSNNRNNRSVETARAPRSRFLLSFLCSRSMEANAFPLCEYSVS